MAYSRISPIFSVQMLKQFLLSSLSLLGFPGGSEGKASAWNVGDPGSFPGRDDILEKETGNPLQYSCLENSMDGGDW